MVEHVRHQRALPFGLDAVDQRVHEVEAQALGVDPARGVADPDAIRPLGETPSGARDEAGADVDAVRLDREPTLTAPPRHRLHEQPVGAAEVEERAVAVDTVGDRLPRRSPLARRAAEARTALVGRRVQVDALETGAVVDREHCAIDGAVRAHRRFHHIGHRVSSRIAEPAHRARRARRS